MGLPVVSDNTLQSYLAEVSRYPVLSPEDEFTIAERYYRNKSMEDAHRLVVSNLRYVIKIALEFRQYGCRLADLIQEGNIGLMVAVKKFNPYKGFRLITYATWWIRSCMQDFILKTRGLVKHNAKALKRKLFYRNGGEATPGAGSAGEVEFPHDLSLNAALGDDGATHLDMLQDVDADPVDAVAESQERAIVKREVTGALALLNEKERMVVEKRVMNDEPESLQKIGDRLGLTRERVRQIESSALKKLQHALSRDRDALATG
ncbi:MAG: RNA polymerase sigma factor RpoD/SigA [Thermodesulfobacteriota bacterium]